MLYDWQFLRICFFRVGWGREVATEFRSSSELAGSASRRISWAQGPGCCTRFSTVALRLQLLP